MKMLFILLAAALSSVSNASPEIKLSNALSRISYARSMTTSPQARAQLDISIRLINQVISELSYAQPMSDSIVVNTQYNNECALRMHGPVSIAISNVKDSVLAQCRTLYPRGTKCSSGSSVVITTRDLGNNRCEVSGIMY